MAKKVKKAAAKLTADTSGLSPVGDVEQSEFILMNMKRTYDQYQTLDTQILAACQSQMLALNNIQSQQLAAMTENSNAMSKQMIRHTDLAIDRQWNVDEQAFVVADILNDSKFQDGLATLFAKTIADGISTKK